MPITPTTSDDELLRRMRSGDAHAFAALYRHHQGPVYRFALLRCGSAGTAADTVQEAFMGLLTGRLSFDPLRGSLPNFLFGVARLLILKHEEPRRREAPLPEPDEDELEPAADDACPLDRVLASEAAEEVRRALARLAPHYREAVIAGAVSGALADGQWAAKAVSRELGTRDFDGVTAEGRQRSYEIPAGEVGNRNPIVVLDETWYAPELQVTVCAKHSDPRSGDYVYRLEGIKRGEPDAALFAVPSDYQVREIGKRAPGPAGKNEE